VAIDLSSETFNKSGMLPSGGRPDLEGVWRFATLTPLERPSELAGKQVLTDEDVANAEAAAVAAERGIDRRTTNGVRCVQQ
jgi:hypothetical protein